MYVGGAMARRVVLALFLVAACTPTVPSAPPITSPSASAPATTVPTIVPSPSPVPVPELGSTVTARYDDGLPRWMGGSFVHRGDEATDFAHAQADASSFLVTGWATYLGQPLSCPIPLDGSTWARDCGRVRFSDVAGITDARLTDAITFRHALARGVVARPLLGPVVVVVHARDPRAAAECGADVAVCSAMMVVERVIWKGDDATAPGPVTEAAVIAALVAAQHTEAAPFAADSVNNDCALPGLFDYALTVPDDVAPRVTCAVLAPSSDALHRAVDQRPGVAPALRSGAVQMEARSYLHGVLTAHVTYRWLVVDNAALMVRTHATPTMADRAFLERLVGLLSPGG